MAPLAVVEPNGSRRRAVAQQVDALGFSTLDQGLDWEPDVVVVATPSHLHVEQARKAAQQGCHLFIEKPLAHANVGIKELAKEVSRRDLLSIVGCNMRFHPGPAKVKELLDQGVIGRILFARIHTGSYLPEWRPGQDYSKSYSANARLGGGCLLDCIHEVDLVRWYVGDIEQVFCMAGKQSTLNIDAEDVATLVCRHKGGVMSEIHLDYVQRTYERGCQIVGEQGSIFWDYKEGVVRWYEAPRGVWHAFRQPESWEANQMYIDEMKHFIGCVHEGKTTTLPVQEAVAVMDVIFAAKASARTGCLVEVAS